MNDRIKELIKQATFTVTDYSMGIDSSHEEFDKEYFAQLIVLECEKAMKNPKWYSESPSNGLCKPIRFACITIKEHFGIKE